MLKKAQILVLNSFLIKKSSKIFSTLFFIVFSFLIQTRAYAQGPALVPENHKVDGNYEINDFIVVAINISKWILIVSGSLALLAFIVGGLMFILSAGNKELVDRGKKSMIGATIGLIVVLLAFSIIDFFMAKMGYDQSSFGGTWYTAPSK